MKTTHIRCSINICRWDRWQAHVGDMLEEWQVLSSPSNREFPWREQFLLRYSVTHMQDVLLKINLKMLTSKAISSHKIMVNGSQSNPSENLAYIGFVDPGAPRSLGRHRFKITCTTGPRCYFAFFTGWISAPMVSTSVSGASSDTKLYQQSLYSSSAHSCRKLKGNFTWGHHGWPLIFFFHGWGIWLAQAVEHAILDLEIMSLNPVVGIEITFKKERERELWLKQ